MRAKGEVVLGKIVERVYLFESKSNPNKDPYETLSYTDGSWSCNCPGWAFRKHCRHIDDAKPLALQSSLEVMHRSTQRQNLTDMAHRSVPTIVVTAKRRAFFLED